jgi:hypothetical protein
LIWCRICTVGMLFLVLLSDYLGRNMRYDLCSISLFILPSVALTSLSSATRTTLFHLAIVPCSTQARIRCSDWMLANARIVSSNPAATNASTHRTAKPISTRASPCAWTDVWPSSSRLMSRLARRCRGRRRDGVVVAECLGRREGMFE